MVNFSLQLTGPQIQYLLNMLGRCPIADALELFQSIQRQAMEQQKPRAVPELTKENYPDHG